MFCWDFVAVVVDYFGFELFFVYGGARGCVCDRHRQTERQKEKMCVCVCLCVCCLFWGWGGIKLDHQVILLVAYIQF